MLLLPAVGAALSLAGFLEVLSRQAFLAFRPKRADSFSYRGAILLGAATLTQNRDAATSVLAQRP